MNTRIRPILIGVGASIGLVTAGLVTSSTAGAAGDPTIVMNASIAREITLPVHAQNLTPDADYTLSATAGVWANGRSSVTRTADTGGAFDANFTLPAKTPVLDSLTITLSPAADPDTPSDQQVVTVDPPTFVVDQYAGPDACPSANTVPFGSNFPPGTYTFTSDYASFQPDTVTAPSDVLGSAAKSARAHLHMTLPDDLPRVYHVTATSDAVTYHFTLHRHRENRASDSERSTPWRHYWTGECFRPGERVTHGPVPPHGSMSAASVTADADGQIHFITDEHPGAHPTVVTEILLTGRQSGQSTGTYPVKLPGTTLRTGETDVEPGFVSLQSSRPGYLFAQNECAATISKYAPSGANHVVWRTPTVGSGSPKFCTLQLHPHGDLTLTSKSGRVVWQTHSRGSAGGNRLVMRGNGALVIVTSAGRVVWTSESTG